MADRRGVARFTDRHQRLGERRLGRQQHPHELGTWDTTSDYWDAPDGVPTVTPSADPDGSIFSGAQSTDVTFGQAAYLPISPSIAPGDVSYSVDGSSASVNQATGQVTGTRLGTSTITATAAGHRTGQLTVNTVVPPGPVGFISPTFTLSGDPLANGAKVNSSIASFWRGTDPVTFSKTGGDDWLSISAAIPAAGATITVDGAAIRVWVAHLDESDYGPARAAAGTTELVSHKLTTTRYAQATASAKEMAPDLARRGATPVILLGDLASPSKADSRIDWPVPDVFARAGLTDSGVGTAPTFSLVSAAGATDRVDYVDYRGGLEVVDSEAYQIGWLSPTAGASSPWPSDHAAALTLFQLQQQLKH